MQLMNDYGIGFSIPNPVKAIKKALAGTKRSVKRTVKNPGKAIGTAINLAPGVAAALAGGGAGLLLHKGGAELMRRAGAPKVLSVAADPSGHITHGVSAGASAGYKKGGLKGLARGGVKGAVSSGRDVTSNPIIKATAAGLTFVIPPAGIALSGGLMALDKGLNTLDTGLRTADKLVGAYAHGSPPVKKAVAAVFTRTAKAAKAGDPDAKRALLALSAANKKFAAAKSFTYLVTPAGKITRGKFAKSSGGGTLGFYVRADGHIERGSFKAG